jgi:hypothetical protein
MHDPGEAYDGQAAACFPAAPRWSTDTTMKTPSPNDGPSVIRSALWRAPLGDAAGAH